MFLFLFPKPVKIWIITSVCQVYAHFLSLPSPFPASEQKQGTLNLQLNACNSYTA